MNNRKHPNRTKAWYWHYQGLVMTLPRPGNDATKAW